MSKNIEKLEAFEKYTGNETFARIKEVMGILGIDFPDDPDFYYSDMWGLGRKADMEAMERQQLFDNPDDFTIILSDAQDADYRYTPVYELENVGTLTINKGRAELTVEKDGYLYKWKRYVEGDFETLHVCSKREGNEGKELSIAFNVRNEGIRTSDINIEGLYDFPVIISTLTEVSADKNLNKFHQKDSIDNYYEFFKKVLLDPKNDYLIPGGIKGNTDLLNRMASVFERLISTLIDNIKTTDQSWRFEEERKQINSKCNSEIGKADDELEEITRKAQSTRDYKVSEAEKKRDSLLAELTSYEAEYKNKEKEATTLNLTQQQGNEEN